MNNHPALFLFHPSDKLTTCRVCVRYSFPAGMHPSDKFTTCRGSVRYCLPAGSHPSDKFTSCRGCACFGFPVHLYKFSEPSATPSACGPCPLVQRSFCLTLFSSFFAGLRNSSLRSSNTPRLLTANSSSKPLQKQMLHFARH